MTNNFDVHPSLIVACFVMHGITICTAMAMEKIPFSTALDATQLEAEDLLPQRGLGALRPGIEVK